MLLLCCWLLEMGGSFWDGQSRLRIDVSDATRVVGNRLNWRPPGDGDSNNCTGWNGDGGLASDVGKLGGPSGREKKRWEREKEHLSSSSSGTGV